MLNYEIDNNAFYKFKCASVNEIGRLRESLRIWSSDNLFSDCQSMARKEMISNSELPLHSIAILGELSVGKSALCQKFFHTGILHTAQEAPSRAPEPCRSDVAEVFENCEECEDTTSQEHHIYERPITVKGKQSRIRILDVNTERHLLDSVHDDGGLDNLEPYLKSSDGFIVAYAVTDRGTFQTAIDILNRITEDDSASEHVILVGNKCDLVRKRRVAKKEGDRASEKYRVTFIETSASLNQNVDAVFENIINQIQSDKLSAKHVMAKSQSHNDVVKIKKKTLKKRIFYSINKRLQRSNTSKVADIKSVSSQTGENCSSSQQANMSTNQKTTSLEPNINFKDRFLSTTRSNRNSKIEPLP